MKNRSSNRNKRNKGAAESQKLRREMDALTNQIQDKDARIRELEDIHGSIDTEAIQRLKDEKEDVGK